MGADPGREATVIGWETIVAVGLNLPGTELGTSYGRPAIKVRGKMISCGGKADDHFVLSATLDEIEMLKDTDPACFYQTPHYEGWPAVLVRYAAADSERIAALIERAWERQASKAMVKARG